MSAAEWEAWCDASVPGDEPPGLGDDEEEEPEPVAEPGVPVLGPAGFGKGGVSDGMPGGLDLALLADVAAGPGDRYAGASDGELDGLIAAWDRVEAHAAARKHAAVAEFIRRRPAEGCEPASPAGVPGDPAEPGDATAGPAGPESVPGGPGRMPAMWDEFAVDELRVLLAENRAPAELLMSRAADLASRLPGTMGLFRGGWLRHDKVKIVVDGTALLDAAESRAVEDLVLGRAGRLTPAGLRPAVAKAVMDVAPDKARKAREEAARDARVQRWAEDSGNAALMGRELPPDEVLAADARITAWAKELRKAGLGGGMDELRARAYLDLLLDTDSRPATPDPAAAAAEPDGGADGADGAGTGDGGTGSPGDHDPGDGGPAGGGPAGPRPPAPGGSGRGAGFAARVNLTVPLTTAAGLADRPGELGGIGPVDPWLARDLLAAAARNPQTSWCATFTDAQGHAAGHGCAGPAPKARGKPGTTDGARDGPGFSFTPVKERDGPPGGYGTWLLRIPGDGPDFLVRVYSLDTENCDHRFQASGHDPGVKLRHLAQVRHATCTGPACRRPAAQCDFEHNIPYEAGGRTCLCNCDPKCRHEHRLKQHPRWQVDQLPDGTVRWTTPSGRSYLNEPTRYPI